MSNCNPDQITQEFVEMKKQLDLLLNADKDKAYGYVWDTVVDLSYHVLMMEYDYREALARVEELTKGVSNGPTKHQRSGIQRASQN
jgi:hypothetical protein